MDVGAVRAINVTAFGSIRDRLITAERVNFLAMVRAVWVVQPKGHLVIAVSVAGVCSAFGRFHYGPIR